MSNWILIATLDISSVDPYHSPEAEKLQLVLSFQQHKENCMKPADSTPNEAKARKLALKNSRFLDKQFRIKENNQRRLRIVRSVKAGHVRGGHTFH